MDGDLISSDDFFGDTAGRDIEEGDRAEGCQTRNRNDECCILVQRTQDRRQLGSGVAMRNVYPGYFSKMVMAHEMDTISVSITSTITAYRTSCSRMPPATATRTGDCLAITLNAEPYFTSRDKRNVWRFIVDQLRNEL
jgi:hypothetical protein